MNLRPSKPARQAARPGRRHRTAAGLFCIVLAASYARAAEQAAAPDPQPIRPLTRSELFLSAQAAYDEGRYMDAAGLYEQLITNGVDNMELHYNLANTRFKQNNLPEAVLHYRRAWRRAPRDPDIRANLHFALNAAGAAEPSPGFASKIFEALSYSEWIAAAAGGYVLLMALLLLALLLRRARRLLLRACLVPALLMLLSLGGWRHWADWMNHPEWVIVNSGATALFGPIEGATAHFKVPLAALVRQRETDAKGWVEIEYDGKEGWIQATYIKRVYP
jgi:tetratricopeptide (TPR) repeat protein